MDINTIIQRVGELGLNEDISTDTELKNRVLGYINMVWRDLQSSILQEVDSQNHRITEYTVTDGTSTLSPIPTKIFSVIDTTEKRILELSRYELIENGDPLIEQEGDPRYYYIFRDELRTYPKNNTTIRVRYADSEADFTLGTTSAQIPIPERFHDVFVWGTLYHLAFDERDFQQQLELNVTLANYQEVKAKISNYYFYNEQGASRTTAEDF